MRRNEKKNTQCEHDCKNAIQIGSRKYMCPLCKELINPLEWFLTVHYGAKFVDCTPKNKKKIQR